MLSLRQALGMIDRTEKMLVVGVGNANDLDLRELADMASEIWLADIDRPSMEAALVREGFKAGTQESGYKDMYVGVQAAIKTTDPKDVRKGFQFWIGDAGGNADGIDDFLETVSSIPSLKLSGSGIIRSDALIAALRSLSEKAQAWHLDSEEGFDLVLSQCLLSQILWPVAQTVWENSGIPWQEGQAKLAGGCRDPLYAELARALRYLALGHLMWTAGRLRPGGMLILNTDVLWKGVPLYGTDVQEMLDVRPFGHDSAGAILQLCGKKEWTWQLDATTMTLVRSYRLQKIRQ